MRLIGINGFKTAGKDTAYEIIAELRRMKQAQMRAESGWRTQRAGFADKLKIMAAKALGFGDLDDQECIAMMNECKDHWTFQVHTGELGGDTRFGFGGREYLQWFGGEARTVFGDTFWIDQVLPAPRYMNSHQDSYTVLMKEVHARYPDTDMLVITDVRYPNEAQRVRLCGGEIWEVIRPGLESDGHASEVALPRELVDKVIVNDGTVADFAKKIASVL